MLVIIQMNWWAVFFNLIEAELTNLYISLVIDTSIVIVSICYIRLVIEKCLVTYSRLRRYQCIHWYNGLYLSFGMIRSTLVHITYANINIMIPNKCLLGITSSSVPRRFKGPFHWHGLTLIPAWISNYINHKIGAWNYLSITKLQRFHGWSLGMDK